MKKVSIIIPVYNVEKYIAKCLDSLVNQTLSDIEIIVVNDGSPDNSDKIIKEYVKKYPKLIKYYTKENGGQGSARNLGYSKSTGEYIGYIDSDDYVDITMFEKMYNKAKKEDLDIVICGNYIVYEDSDKKLIEPNTYVLPDSRDNAFFGKLGVCTKIYKRELIEGVIFRSKVWYEDLDFTVNILSKAKKIGYIDEPLYYYLYRIGSTMNNSNINRNLEILEAFNAIKNNKKDRELIEFLAIDNIYISAIVRVINAKANNKAKRKIINQMIDYMKTNFKDFKSNKYIKYLSHNRKLVYHLINLRQYWIIKLLFKLKNK